MTEPTVAPRLSSSPMLTNEAAVAAAADAWDHAFDGDDEKWARGALTTFFAAQDRDALVEVVIAALAQEWRGDIAYRRAAARAVIDALLGKAE